MTVTPDQAKNNFMIGEYCSGVYYGNQLFRIANGSFTSVQTPSGWWRSSVPESLTYGIGANILYRYNASNSNFSNIFTFPTHDGYQIRTHKSGLIVVGANRTIGNNTTSISQNIYIFSQSETTLNLINKFNISSAFPGADWKFIPFLTSPKLTKLLIDFLPQGSNTTVRNILKSIDYQQKSIIDLPIK